MNAIAVDAWGATGREASLASLFAAIEVDVFEVEGVDVTWDISIELNISYLLFCCAGCSRKAGMTDLDGSADLPKECQADIDQEISTASCDEIDTNRWHCEVSAFIQIQQCVLWLSLTDDGDQDQQKSRDGTHCEYVEL